MFASQLSKSWSSRCALSRSCRVAAIRVSDLMEKLRKSEEEARRGKTWEGFAEAMWVGAKSPHVGIRPTILE